MVIRRWWQHPKLFEIISSIWSPLNVTLIQTERKSSLYYGDFIDISIGIHCLISFILTSYMIFEKSGRKIRFEKFASNNYSTARISCQNYGIRHQKPYLFCEPRSTFNEQHDLSARLPFDDIRFFPRTIEMLLGYNKRTRSDCLTSVKPRMLVPGNRI